MQIIRGKCNINARMQMTLLTNLPNGKFIKGGMLLILEIQVMNSNE